MTYLFLIFLILQTSQGRITVTLLDAQENPVSGNVASLMSSSGQVIADCTTNSNGSCTILVEEVTADESGLIRAVLTIASRGRRSVIWPGGPLEVTINLDENGQIFVPSDHYITPTPKNTATPTPTHTTTQTPEHTATPTHTANPTPEANGTVSLRETVEVRETVEPIQTAVATENTEKTEDGGPAPLAANRSLFNKVLFLLIFLLVLSFIPIALYRVKKPSAANGAGPPS